MCDITVTFKGVIADGKTNFTMAIDGDQGGLQLLGYTDQPPGG